MRACLSSHMRRLKKKSHKKQHLCYGDVFNKYYRKSTSYQKELPGPEGAINRNSLHFKVFPRRVKTSPLLEGKWRSCGEESFGVSSSLPGPLTLCLLPAGREAGCLRHPGLFPEQLPTHSDVGIEVLFPLWVTVLPALGHCEINRSFLHLYSAPS